MTKDDIIQMAKTAGVLPNFEVYVEDLERFAALVAEADRATFPDLGAVITWLENGCDPEMAAAELRLYAAAIRARTTP